MDSPDYSDSDDCSVDTDECDGCHNNQPSKGGTFIRPKVTDLGKRVIFTSGNDRKQKYGVLRYIGEPEFSEGVWCGVELDQCTGKNNGSIHGIRYFTCNTNFGVFLPLSKVELDTNRRSRGRLPNSLPSSRSSSVERKEPLSSSRPTSGKSTAASSMNPSVHRISIQHEFSRLSQPLKRTSQPNIAAGKRQPMKAFATKGISASNNDTKKPLAPFRSGGMYKAASSENIRALNEKDKPKQKQKNQGMPAKKSSSERDLRNAGKTASSSSNIRAPIPKVKRKQVRVNSCSDLLAPDKDPKPSIPASTSHTSLDNHAWPRTSTPGNRDELTPDGCSSPEESEDAVSSKEKQPITSSNPNTAFLEMPGNKPPFSEPDRNQASGEEEGLDNLVKQFTETERSSPTLNTTSVQAPDHPPRQYFKNQPSGGTATLSHPLTRSNIIKRAEILKQLLGSKQTVCGSP